MKKINFIGAMAGLLFSVNALAQTTIITQWDFNGGTSSEVNTTPNIGSGTVTPIGGITVERGSGSASGGSTDPVTPTSNNYAYHTLNYAAQGAGDKTRGVEFKASTAGYKDIIFSFDMRLSNTANKAYLVQYTTDGTVWTDFTTITANDGGDKWYNGNVVDLSSISAFNNNPNAGIRVLSTFASGSNYVAATSASTYATSGTVRFDMVTFKGTTTLAVNDVNGNAKNKIYPNPVNAGENVVFGKATDYIVFSTSGQAVKTGKNAASFSTTSLAKGVYIVKTNEGTQKFIVK